MNDMENSFKITYRFTEPKKKDMRLIFFIIFSCEIALGIYFSYFKDIVLNDALSRTANSFYVLFVKPRRFASIGLVWNPLPSVLQLPLVYLAKFWRPMVSSGIAANIITALFSALSCSYIYKIFIRLKVPKVYSIILIALYVTNPFIFFYGSNGMSEVIFFFMIIYSVLCLTLWIKEGSANYIVKIAFALAMAFFCRYEAVPFALAIGVGVVLIIFFSKKEKKFVFNNSFKEKYFYAESSLVILYTPFLYSIMLWILFNWIISGNALYFLNSAYSNSAQSQYAATITNSISALKYILKKCEPFMPLFIGIVIIRIKNKRLLRIDFLILLFMVMIMIIFHFTMLIKGNSYGWFRFFSYSLPICFAWIPYELSEINKKHKKFEFSVLIVSLLLSSILTGTALLDASLSPEEHNLIITNESHKVADYINSDLSDEIILSDSFLTSGILVNVQNVDNLVISSSLNFKEAVKNPWKYGVTYILVPDKSGIGKLDAINTQYPDLYKYGAEWCTLVKEFDGYKLFKVNY
ncbi:glycosyltransferase family 39 protein [Clostridium sp. JS66]|uniref:glycosyltransferase family 39 protein n=1 Tax=Clostridium sp. JS66 TaxID=3064705 RepID=UPI00298E6BFE|nr:glycosyltransferase family 39 protein [Clostridium sp. JS66]WPC43603.1 glycosyltransferase family 39 protein [Clostridium sp. JS66]